MFTDTQTRQDRDQLRSEEAAWAELMNESSLREKDLDARAAVLEADNAERTRRNRRNLNRHLNDELKDLAAAARQKRTEHIAAAGAARPGAERAKQQQLARSAHERAKQWEEMAREIRVEIRSEPLPYGPNSPHSYFHDLLLQAAPGVVEGRDRAASRLERHARSVGLDALGGDARARRALRDIARMPLSRQTESESEWRAMTSGSSSGGAFVTPDYLTDQYAAWRSYIPAIADAATQLALPDYGLEVLVPAVESGPDVVAEQAVEGAGLANTSLTTGYRTAVVATYSGSSIVSQQLFDRSGPTHVDEVLFAQLREALDAEVDSAVATAMIAGATTNLARGTFTNMGSFWSDVNNAAASLETTAGTALPATHLFVPPKNFRWLAAQVDGQDRPLWTPDGDSSPNPTSGFTGYRIASTGVYTDGSIPMSGTDAQFVVANPTSTLVLKGEPVVQVIPDPDAGTLSALVRLYQYVAIVVRYPSAAATISGAAYPASPTFT